MTTVPDVPQRWRKSTRSAQDTDCVEVHPDGAIRDSKNPGGPRLTLEVSRLLAAVKADRIAR